VSSLLAHELLRAPVGVGDACFFGVHTALVTDVKDPDGQGRVRIKLPWSPDPKSAVWETWARLSTLMAGGKRGTWFIPDVDDEVLVAFLGGDPRQPFVVGALWNGKDAPPQSMDGSGKNAIKQICSRNGVKVTFDDQDGQESLKLETPGGGKVTIKDGPSNVKVEDANGNSVELATAGITVTASAKVTVQASQVAISAGMVQVDAAMSKFSGVVQADTVITNSVVSASYTPGAGNIW
jgi:uncharacterized protein involved in type VI secretion and phage assembly